MIGMNSSFVTLHSGYLDVKIKGRLGDRYRRRYISLQSNAMLGRRWLEVKDHNGSTTASERIELEDNWMVTERISKGNKRCVTDIVINGLVVITFTSPLPQERAEWMKVLENLKKIRDDITCRVTVCQSQGAAFMGLSGDYLLKLLDNSLVLHTPSGVGVAQWMMEDVHLFTMSGDTSLLLHASHRKDEEGSPHIVQLEFTTNEGIAALQLVKDWSCRLVQSCDTHEKLIQLLRSSKGAEGHYSASTLPRNNSSDASSTSNNHLSRASRFLSSLRQKSTRSKRRPLSRVAVPPTFVPAPVTKRPFSIAGLPGDFNAMQLEESSASPTIAPPILPRPSTTLSHGEYVDDEISATGYHSDYSSGESNAITSKPKPYLEILPDEEEDSKNNTTLETPVIPQAAAVVTSTSTATPTTTTPPQVRRHSLVHRHSSAAYAMEHSPILTHPALDTMDKPPVPPRTYKSSGSTDSLSSDSCSPVQNKRPNNLSNSDSEPEEAFIPLAKPSMRFKVDVTQWKMPYGTLPSSPSDGLQQTSIPEEHEIVSQSLSSSPPPLPPKPSLPDSCTCTCHGHHHHHHQHKATSKKRRHRHPKMSVRDGRRGSDQLSLTPQSSVTSHSSVTSQPSFGSDTSGIQEDDHEFDNAIAILNDAFQSLSRAATSIGANEHATRNHGSFQIDFNAIPSQQKPAEYLEPVNSSPQHYPRSQDSNHQSSSNNVVNNMPKSSRTLCRLYPPSFVTTSSSSTVFASHVRHH